MFPHSFLFFSVFKLSILFCSLGFSLIIVLTSLIDEKFKLNWGLVFWTGFFTSFSFGLKSLLSGTLHWLLLPSRLFSNGFSWWNGLIDLEAFSSSSTFDSFSLLLLLFLSTILVWTTQTWAKGSKTTSFHSFWLLLLFCCILGLDIESCLIVLVSGKLNKFIIFGWFPGLSSKLLFSLFCLSLLLNSIAFG